MSLVPLLHVEAIAPAVRFYVDVLGFRCAGVWPSEKDPAYAVLLWTDEAGALHEAHVSSHGGDGRSGQAFIVVVRDVCGVHAACVARGLDQAHRTDSPVHLGPTQQTWGAIEFYADDPSGNRVIFAERLASA